MNGRLGYSSGPEIRQTCPVVNPKSADDVRVSWTARLFGPPGNLVLGYNVRIDDFTVIVASSPIVLGDCVHLGPMCSVHAGGGARITLETGVAISAGTRIYSRSDDYVGASLCGPEVDERYKPHPTVGEVIIGRWSIIGANSVVLPLTQIGRYVSVGALSLVKGVLSEGHLYGGCPAKPILTRDIEKMRALDEAWTREQNDIASAESLMHLVEE